MSEGIAYSSPTCLHSVNNNNGNLSIAITTAVCVSQSCTSATIFSHFRFFSPLINKQHFRDSSEPKCTKSAHLQCSCSLSIWPSLACPFSHNARHPPDDGSPSPPLPLLLSILTWEISLSVLALFNMLAWLLCILLSLWSAALIDITSDCYRVSTRCLISTGWHIGVKLERFLLYISTRTSDWHGVWCSLRVCYS